MSGRDLGASYVASAAAPLRELAHHGRDLRPQDVDPSAWGAALLHDLADVAESVGRAAETVFGERSDNIRQHAYELSAAIDERATLLRHSPD